MTNTDAQFQDALGILSSDGYLQTSLPPSTQARIADMLANALEFFREPIESKINSRLPEGCGYRPYGVEYSADPTRPDQVESFTVSRRLASHDAVLTGRTAQFLRQTMLDVFDDFERIAETIAVRLAQTLTSGRRGEDLRGALRSWSRLQLNYSQPATVEAQFINDLHEDGALLTIAGATGPGLEIQTLDNRFQDVSFGVDQVTIMPGEILALLSGWEIRPLFHRVRPHQGLSERVAYLFFVDIEPTKCAPWRVTDGNRSIDIGQRVLTNVNRFGLAGFSMS